MDDKRIKLITKEMFIAWGMICICFIVVDNIWHNLGITPMYTCQPAYTGMAAIAKAAVIYSSLLAIIASYPFVYLFKFMWEIDRARFLAVADTSLLIIQFLFYWYLGNLFGRLIVWIKCFHKKSKPPNSQ